MKIVYTREKLWLEKWDEFVSDDNNGSHLALSDWLRSYESYGFDFEIGIFLEEEKIIGGFGAVIAKMSLFRFYIIPYGPIVLNNNKLVLKQLLQHIAARSKELHMLYSQITIPSFEKFKAEDNLDRFLEKNHFKKGAYFKYVFSFTGLNWVDLKGYKTIEEILLDFKSSVRRDIRSSERKDIFISYAMNSEEIELAYDLCLENARNGDYALRDWKDIKKTIFSLIEKGNAKFIIGSKNNEIKGAVFLIKAGGYYSYIFGGTKKEKPDLLIGHLLQWEAIKLSFLENCIGYNLSLGGSKGVQEFKNGFNTKQIIADNSKFYLINKPLLFSVYLFLEKYMKPYKNRIAKILVLIKKIGK